MDLNNIKRNQLDYLLTDVLPTELSDRFTYSYFYDYLMTRKHDLDRIHGLLTSQKNKNGSDVLFSGSSNWVSAPLKYTIMKQLHDEREISLLQPLAALELFLFISVYQKEILSLLSNNSVFSLRYHRRNNDLIYKSRSKSVTKYFCDLSLDAGREILEQTGMFFNIGPYKSIVSFTSSEKWLVLNSKYNYFIRTDYKACFDSIYTHTFNWIIGKDVNDTKAFKNGSIYTTVDRILMNINARTSNGIVVGPEFSRMVAELLLQTIDKDVYNMLLNLNYEMDEHYNVYRYVDDVFIFAKTEELANKIVDLYSKATRKYLLRLNEAKLYKSKVPFVLETWLNNTNIFTNRVCNLLFYSSKERIDVISQKNLEMDDGEKELPYLLKGGSSISFSKRTIMNQFNELVCKYEPQCKTITAYFLGTLLNKVSRNKTSVTIFKKNVSEKTVFDFLDIAFYAYSFFPNFNNTQKLLSIISYVRDEFDVFKHGNMLQKLISRYAFVFDKTNIHDSINLILMCCQAKIEIPYKQEKSIVQSLKNLDDPVLWASYLLYSTYNKQYHQEIHDEIVKNLIERIESIVRKDGIYTYREFWWVLIFNKSPYLTHSEQAYIDNIIANLKIASGTSAGEIVGNIFVDYLKKSPNQFFEWDMNKRDFLRNMTFKTRERTIFKNYKENLRFMYWESL